MNKLTDFKRANLLKKFSKSLGNQDPQRDFKHKNLYSVYLTAEIENLELFTIKNILEQELENKKPLILVNSKDLNAENQKVLKNLKREEINFLRAEITTTEIYKNPRFGLEEKKEAQSYTRYCLAPLPIYGVQVIEKELYLPVFKVNTKGVMEFVGFTKATDFKFALSEQMLTIIYKTLELRLDGKLYDIGQDNYNYYLDNIECFLFETPVKKEFQNIDSYLLKTLESIDNKTFKVNDALINKIQEINTKHEYIFELMFKFEDAFSENEYNYLLYLEANYKTFKSIKYIVKAYLLLKAKMPSILSFYQEYLKDFDTNLFNASQEVQINFLKKLTLNYV